MKEEVREEPRLEPKVVPLVRNCVSTSTPTKPAAPCKTPLSRESIVSNESDVGTEDSEDASNIANTQNSAIGFDFNQYYLILCIWISETF